MQTNEQAHKVGQCRDRNRLGGMDCIRIEKGHGTKYGERHHHYFAEWVANLARRHGYPLAGRSAGRDDCISGSSNALGRYGRLSSSFCKHHRHPHSTVKGQLYGGSVIARHGSDSRRTGVAGYFRLGFSEDDGERLQEDGGSAYGNRRHQRRCHSIQRLRQKTEHGKTHRSADRIEQGPLYKRPGTCAGRFSIH